MAYCWLASLIVLPIYPAQSLKPTSATDPTWGILSVLALTVGLPYFLLSSTGPLLQAWYAREHKGGMPYRLYALSNAGSMFALLSYPVLFEPHAHHSSADVDMVDRLYRVRPVMRRSWPSARVVFATACRGRRTTLPPGSRSGQHYIMWLLLPVTASVLLLAITNHISQNVAAIPFLWILPLSLYLLSFILCFEGSGWYRRNPYLQLVAVALGSMAYGITVDTAERPADLGAAGHLRTGTLRLLHGVPRRVGPIEAGPEIPHTLFPDDLRRAARSAEFSWRCIAPHIFPSFYELQLGLVLCAVLLLFALSLDPETAGWFRGWRAIVPFAGALATVAMGVYMGMNIQQQAS